MEGHPTITARYRPELRLWSASADDLPQVTADADQPLVALQRLLDQTAAAPGAYQMKWTQEAHAGWTPQWRVNWQPPVLHYRCPECRDEGPSDSPATGACPRCHGRGLVPLEKVPLETVPLKASPLKRAA